jgi:hypothetical protein
VTHAIRYNNGCLVTGSIAVKASSVCRNRNLVIGIIATEFSVWLPMSQGRMTALDDNN